MSEVSNPPAFPCIERRNTSTDPLATPREIAHPGMSLRDWFAGQSLNGALSRWPDRGDHGRAEMTQLARTAYAIAEALLTERMKGSQP